MEAMSNAALQTFNKDTAPGTSNSWFGGANLSSRWPVPHIISYQGRLTGSDGNPLADDTYIVWFQIFNQANGGESIWD